MKTIFLKYLFCVSVSFKYSSTEQ